MALAVNFTALSSLDIVRDSDQLLIRLNNSLSGSDGFARATKSVFLSSLNLNSLTGNWQNTWTSYRSQSAALFNSASSPSQGTVRLTSQDLTTLDVDVGLQVADSPTFANTTVTGIISTAPAGVIVGNLSACNYTANVNTLNFSTYVLELSDTSKTLIDIHSTTANISIPPSTQTNFTVGEQIVLIQGNKSASNYTKLSAGAGVTINSFSDSLSLGGNYAAATLIKSGTDTWYLIGNLK